ncbi:MAG: epoxyqueuosine reductase QueH [Lachnospiraceae bacterium]|nr:epoxyqueuosine reductase QueH [Lachnospiraceae bacterium]
MNKINYQQELERLMKGLGGKSPRLFLHSCCAPCSSYCLEYLRQYFQITIFYYNPNISMPEEYRLRVEEQKRLIEEMNADGTPGVYPIAFVEGKYDPETFFALSKGLENCPEGGERCFLCYELRLREAACQAKEGGFDYFTTTLTISPLKNAQKLNEIGQRLAAEYGVTHLPSDFKKKGGYLRSTELSREHGLYRQDYCGCAFSKAESLKRRQEKE